MSRLRAAGGVLGRALLRAHRDDISRRAAALSYSTLLALVPLLAVVSIFVAQALREDDGRTLLLLAELLPFRQEAVTEALRSFVAQARSVSSLAVAGFLVTSLLTFFAVQETLFAIFRVTAPPAWNRRLLTFTLLFFWGPVLIGSVYAGLLLLTQSAGPLGTLLRESTLLQAVPAVVTLLGLAMLFWRAANGRIRLRHAFVGSAVATALIELLKLGFGLYVASFTAVPRAVYGSFAIALFFVISVQLAWWMLLFGAEVAATLGVPEGAGEAARGLRPDPWIALTALERLGTAGRPSYSTEELARELALPDEALRPHLAPLVERGLVEAPLTPAGRWRLAVAPGRVRLEAVFDAYEPRRPPAPGDDGEAGADLARLRERLAGARAEALAGLALDDWLKRRPGPSGAVDADGADVDGEASVS